MAVLEEHTFTYDAGRKTTFYLAAGPQQGPLLIFCHGWPAIACTWRAQLEYFAEQGYRVVAPDMPGYGRSTANKVATDYSLEVLHGSLLALLSHLERERATWIGHDWGAVTVWSFVSHYPEKALAVACLARPYHTLEFGLEEVLPLISRTVYPEDEYPYGQYDYQVYYQQDFEAATTWFDADVPGVLRAMYLKGKPEEVGRPGISAKVTKVGGWLGGAPSPPPHLRAIPSDALCIDEDMLASVTTAMENTGFWPANAYYSNNAENRKYALEKSANGGYLDMPAIFIGANWDPISDITISKIAEPMRHFARQLTEVHMDAGHWVGLEKSVEVNEAIMKWLRHQVGVISDSVSGEES